MPDRAPPPSRRLEAPVPLPPVDYPWEPVDRAGLVTAEGFCPLGPSGDPDATGRGQRELDQRLRGLGAPGLADREPVLGVGSNRNAEVLRQKFLTAGIAPSLAVAPVVVDGVAVGHSAHVSRRGYVAAAPVAAPGRRIRLTVTWLDAAQLAALDVTEPNYERIALAVRWAWPSSRPVPQGADGDAARSPVGCGGRRGSDGGGTRQLWVYRSRWGLLGRGGEALALSAQPVVQAYLRTVPGVEALWSVRLGPAEVTGRLADPVVRERVRAALVAAGLVVPSGLGEQPPRNG